MFFDWELLIAIKLPSRIPYFKSEKSIGPLVYPPVKAS